MSSLILKEINKSVITLTFNQPDQLNALNEEMGLLFHKRLKEISKDKQIRALVLTGAGRAFSSGGNLDMLEAKTKKSIAINKAQLKKFYRLFLEVRNLPIPVIAAINGPAVGAGFCLALACDLRYASDQAKMGANFSRLGLAPGMGGTYLITRLAGPARAAEIMMLGEIFSSQKAMEHGLLNEIVPHETLLHRCHDVAQKLANNAPIPLKQIKKGIQKAQHQTLETLFDYDSQNQAICFKTQDLKEGIAAIREKRQPQFKGI